MQTGRGLDLNGFDGGGEDGGGEIAAGGDEGGVRAVQNVVGVDTSCKRNQCALWKFIFRILNVVECQSVIS